MAGYNWFEGKSNNAVRAEEKGLVTKSKITAAWLRENGINETATFIKFLIKADVIWPDEWHHTSKYFNETNYYSAESIKEHLATLEEDGRLAIWREMFKIPALRRVSQFALYQEHLRRRRGFDMFGDTEPHWQEDLTPAAEA